MQPSDQYRDRIEHFGLAQEVLEKQYRQISYVRLGSFVLLVLLFALLSQHHIGLALTWLLIGVVVFGKMMAWHEQFRARADRAMTFKRINEQELSSTRHDHSWNDNGVKFADANHPYANDLDIVGRSSLFQLVNRGQTESGRAVLVSWLLHDSPAEQITARQSAGEELKSDLEFRQELQVEGALLERNERDLEDLQAWLSSPDLVLGKKGYILALHILPFLILPATIAAAYYWGLDRAWLPLIIPAVILLRTKKRVDDIHILSGAAAKVLDTHARMIQVMEDRDWSATLLQQISAQISTEGGWKASKSIRKLSYAIGQLNVRENFFAILFNLFGFWDLHWVYRMEKLKSRVDDKMMVWFDALAEMEALSSLANLAYNHPEWVIPELAENEEIDATAVGHPMISPDKRVDNSITMPLHGHIKLITGSNMAGKSTFLRSVGTNLVLAMAGSVVCASAFRFRPARIYTSMRTADDLEEGASTFYAELARLQMIIKATEEDATVLFLLDEILKGTNSADRHRGSRALINQLLRNQSAGLVATHDLALTKMEAEADGQIENWYFDVVIENERLAFDYQIKRGICDSFNASHLMKKMGIALDESD